MFWTADDLHDKLAAYKEYFNSNRSHMSLDAKTPDQMRGSAKNAIMMDIFPWKKHAGGIVELPKRLEFRFRLGHVCKQK